MTPWDSTRRPRWLRGIEIHRVSLVDKPANPDSRIEFYKRQDEEQMARGPQRCQPHGIDPAKCTACIAKERARLLAKVVVTEARISQLEAALIAKTRNPPPDADPDSRSKYNGPAAQALGRLKERHRRELDELNERGAGRPERNRMVARHTAELQRARAAAEVESYERSPAVSKSYELYDAVQRRLGRLEG